MVKVVSTNRLLAALPKNEYRRLLPSLEQVALSFGEVLHMSGDIISYVYFPNDSIISLLAEVADRSTLEVGIVGNEGMAGISIFLGVDTTRNRTLVQGAGTAMRMKAATLRTETQRTSALSRLLRRYTHSLLTQVAQGAVCNRFHTVDARLARWLLMTRDRLHADAFPLTQEFLSNMLGVRRERVSHAASALQQADLISYSRGRITIFNRAGLETVACACYLIVKDSSDDFLAKR